jgi:hypothetical protein
VLEGEQASEAVVEREIAVLARGLPETRAWAGAVEPDGTAVLKLDVPGPAVASLSSLRVAVDPEPITAVLAGLADLDPRPGMLARLHAYAIRRLLAPSLEARRLDPPGLAPSRPLEEIVHLLAASRDDRGGWGPATASVVLALLRPQALGEERLESLLAPALACLAEEPPEPRALLARALAGEERRKLTGLAPSAPTPDGRVFLARAGLAEAGEAIAVAGELRTVEAKAELLSLLIERGSEPGLQAKLVDEILLARQGSGWSDPDDAGAAMRALIALAALTPERPGNRVRVDLEERQILETWSGAGLQRWTGVARETGPQVASRARLRIGSRGPDRLLYAASVRAWVRRRLPPPTQQGLTVTRRLERPDGTPLAGPVAVGERLLCRISWSIDDSGPETNLLLEVPVPGGCRLLDPPPGSALREGMLVWEPDKRELTLELLAILPGEYVVLPARIGSLRDPGRRATSDELRLRIR